MKRYYIKLEGLTTEQAGEACDKLVELGANKQDGISGYHVCGEFEERYEPHFWVYLGIDDGGTLVADNSLVFEDATLITYDELMTLGTQPEYTTKPIELPLSLDKEYVLVDVDGYCANDFLNKQYVNECKLTQPFKLEVTTPFGYINLRCIINTNEDPFFREVVRESAEEPMPESLGSVDIRSQTEPLNDTLDCHFERTNNTESLTINDTMVYSKEGDHIVFNMSIYSDSLDEQDDIINMVKTFSKAAEELVND